MLIWVLCSILIIDNIKAKEYNQSWFTIDYNPCTATMVVTFRFLDRTGSESDWIEEAKLEFRAANGTRKTFFTIFENDHHNCLSCNKSLNNYENHSFKYKTDYANSVYSTKYYETGSGDKMFNFEVTFKDVDPDIMGDTYYVYLTGNWHNGDAGSNDTELDYEKSAATKMIPIRSGLTTTGNCNEVVLNWTNPSFDCSTFSKTKIYRNGSYIAEAASNVSSYVDDSAVEGVTYNYKLRSQWNPNNYTEVYTEYTSEVQGTRVAVPSIPTITNAISFVCDSMISLNWTANGAFPSYYKLQRKKSPGLFNYSVLADSIPGTSTSYIDTINLERDQKYVYRIKAINACGDSEYSESSGTPGAEASFIPLEPKNLSIQSDTNKFNISWDDKSNNESGFILLRQGGDNERIFEIAANTTNYVDSDVISCKDYTYTLKVKSDCFPDGVGSLQKTKKLKPILDYTFDSTSLDISKGYYPDKVTLTWTMNNANAINAIKIYRRPLGSIDYVLLATLNSGSNLYNDIYAEAGILYEYKIQAEAQCATETVYSNETTAIGFRTKSGIVTGQVTYGGGTAVQNVEILANSTAGIMNKSITFNGNNYLYIRDNAGLNLDSNFLFECWINPTEKDRVFDVVNKEGSFKLRHRKVANKYTFYIEDDEKVSIPESMIPLNSFSYLSVQLRNDSLEIYVNGKLKSSVFYNGTIPNNVNNIEIGKDFVGSLSEIRFWNKSKSPIELSQDFSRYLAGNEDGLKFYLRTNEGQGKVLYDASNFDNVFNKNHAYFSDNDIIWNNNGPSTSQLRLLAYTDINGNYFLNMPYQGAGESFILTPSYLTHQFDPSSRALFVGDGSLVQNSVNFIDKSSFSVTGNVIYKNTSCGVADAPIFVDGQQLVTNGVISKTDPTGAFDIQVPIGEHVVEVIQNGHVYSINRFPSSGKHNFQEPISGIQFVDSTLLKVVGRVVGGLREASKVPGFGKSKNNIGQAQLIFKSQFGNGCSKDTVITDLNTGEYSIELPPLNYQLTVNIPSNPTINFGTISLLKLGDFTNPTTKIDSTFDTNNNFITTSPTVTYNKQLDFIYRVDPIISVSDKDGISPFIGDTSYTDISGVTRNLKTNPFRWPVLHQGNDEHYYRCMIKVFELYENLNNNKKDSVPNTDGILLVDNELADLKHLELNISEVNTLDSLKSLIYTFKPGFPNFNENVSIPAYSFTGKLQLSLKQGSGKIIQWLPVPSNKIPFGGDAVYRYYLLGTRSNGEQFVTEGPQVIEYVLRDPPGTASTSTRGIETTKTEKTGWSWNLANAVHTTDDIYLGADFSVGVGVVTDNEIENNNTFGFKASISGGRSGSQSIVTTNTSEWSTYGGTSISPGASSDLYIGKSKNVQFGISEELTIIPNSYADSIETVGQEDSVGVGFTFGKKYGLSIIPGGYSTQFMFNEYDIKNLIIPNLINFRNKILQTNPKYTSHLSLSDDNYGKNNDDPVFGNSASTTTPNTGDFEDFSGPSYTLSVPPGAGFLDLILVYDSVRYINQQIYQWTEAIRLNEWEKVVIGNKKIIDSCKLKELQKLEEEYFLINDLYTKLALTSGLGVIASYAIIAYPVPGSAIAGYAAFAITTGSGIAEAEIVDEHSEYLAKKQRIIDKFETLGNPLNYTLTGGTNFHSQISHGTAVEHTNTVEYALGASYLVKAAVKINGNGFGLEKGVELDYTNSHDWSNEESSTETIGYTLDDPDIGDLYSVDVYPSILGWGPIFKNKAGGATACPYEGEIVTEYYEPGTVISEGTQQIDKPSITASPIYLTNIPVEEAAVFNLTIGNESEIGYTMAYDISIAGESNPFGAIVRIDGLPTATVVVAGNSSTNKVLTIQKGPGPVYNYDNILVLVHSQCQFTGGAGFVSDIVDSVYLSAHFLPSCTNVRIATPDNLWVLNNSYHDTMPVAMVDYNINYFDLENLRLDYKPSNESQWIGLETFHKDTTGLKDPHAQLIPQDKSFTLFNWDVAQLPDGNYDLRVVSNCELSDKNSIIHTGVIDRINPHAFGNPSPADGILSPNDEISIKFNEPIDLGSINQSSNFDIRGVLNNTIIDHNISLSFDGIDDYAEIPPGVPLDNRSFTIEFSVLRDVLGEQTILSQGTDTADQLYIGFDANNKLVFRINGTSVASVIRPFSTTGKWHNVAISYDAKNDNVQFYEASSTTTAAVINTGATSIVPKYVGNMPMLIGKRAGSTNKLLNGNLHDLRIWNTVRSLAQFSADKSKLLTGKESGLMYHWLMDEATGVIAADHARHLDAIVNGATWQLNPNGKSANFQTSSSQYLKYKTNNIAITDEMDFTIEFWFKNGTAGNPCLFSNGTGTGLSSDSLLSWNIVKQDSFIRIRHHRFDFQATNKFYFDNNWHHFAMVMQRAGNLSVYVDGNFESSMPSDEVRQLGGAAMFLGARGFINGPTDSLSKFYGGLMDEFRFWSLARTYEQLNRDRVNRMMGDELGLMLYLPFESYSVDLTGIKILTGTFNDQSLTVDSTIISTATLSSNTPTIKLQRPVQSIDFNYSVNNDQIILTPTSSPDLIENVTLDVTVKGIKDLHGNIMQAPKTWIAYVDKNQIVWQEEMYKFSMFKGESLNFETSIYNRGGAAKKFNITDIPSWLMVTPSTGVIAPNSVINISFSVDPGINLGQYNVNLGLLTDFNFKEKLILDLKVNAKEPDWKVNKTQFENNMSFVGILKINGLFSTDVRDKIAAFIGQEVRGVANLEYVAKIDAYRIFLTVHHNSSDEFISFKIWDASSGKIYSDVFPTTYTFISNDIKGTVSAPVVFEASSVVSYEIPVYSGWNWVSFFLDTPTYGDTSLKAKLACIADTSVQIKRDVGFISYNGNNWIGSAFNSLSPLYLYKMKKTSFDTLILRGTVANPANKKINLVNNWNWIGYVSIRNQEINSALAGLTPAVGDVLKSKYSFSIYGGTSQGWIGSLKTLIPGEGYMYKSLATGTKSFTWPVAGMFESAKNLSTRTELDPYWKTQHQNYQSNMTIIAQVEDPCALDLSSENYGIGYKDRNGNWRGKYPVQVLEGVPYCFLTLAVDLEDTLTAFLIDKKGNKIYDLRSSIIGKPNAEMGSFDQPYQIDLRSEFCKEIYNQEAQEKFEVVPIVFSNDVTAYYKATQNDPKAQIRLMDGLGKTIFVKELEVQEGNQSARLPLGSLNLTPSLYFIELYSHGKVFTQKLIKSH